MPNHTLVLLRHAKASSEHSLDDPSRPLTERGQRDARAAGAYLADAGIRAEVVLCSTSLRTRQTLASAAVAASDVRFLDEIYEADVDDLLGVLRDVPAEAPTALMVGHAPGIPELSRYLADGPDEDYPTCGLAVLETDQEWTELGRGGARLVAFHTPKGGLITS